jgi:hypothetical protein
MEPQIELALRRAAEEAGIVDVDAVNLPAFADARALVKLENSTVTGTEEAIARMREAKPALFPEHDWAKIGEREFADRDAELRERLYVRLERAPRANYSSLDAARLNDNELTALRRHLAGVSDSGDDATLEDARVRLGVTAA